MIGAVAAGTGATGAASGSSSIGSSIGASAAASSMDTGGSILINLIQNQYNKRAAEAARDYNERMVNTAHQREVNDLKAAGLNPILSATGGSGAGSIPSPVPNMDGPEISPAAKFMETLSALQAIDQAKADIEEKKAATKNLFEKTNTERTLQEANSAQKARDLSQVKVNEEIADKTVADKMKSIADMHLSTAQAEKAYSEAQANEYDNVEKQQNAKIYSGQAGEFIKWLDYLKSWVPLLQSKGGNKKWNGKK